MKRIKVWFFHVMAELVLLCVVFIACGGTPTPISAKTPPPADELDAAVRETSNYLNKQLPKGNKLVILNIQSDFPALSEYIIDELIANTVNDRVFSVVDRQQLNAIRAELKFQMSDEVDDATAQELGRMAGAQIIISGAISKIGTLYRLRIRALSVQSAQIEGQFNRNIPDGPTVAALVKSQATGYGGNTVTLSNTSNTGNKTSTSTTTQVVTSTTTTTIAPKKFTVTFNANGASGNAPASQTVQSGESITIPDKGAMTNSQKTFGGWSFTTNGTGTIYAVGETLFVNSSIQLYAWWIEKFTVTFNANGASGNAPVSQTVQSGESITIPDKGAMTNSQKTFGGWSSTTDGTGVIYAVGETFVVNSNTQLYARWIEKVYKIGDKGPAGGIVFYDKGNKSDGWQYLEAAPASTEFKSKWAVNSGSVEGKEGIGYGKKNTQAIFDYSLQTGQSMPAARLCKKLQYGGYDDWFLPSKLELGLMYLNLKESGIGNFSGEWYWSSSHCFHYSSFKIWVQKFSDGSQGYDYPTNEYSVRACRQF